MPKIFEVFGYRLDDTSLEAQECRKKALCPFMEAPCDGGGNRYLSHVHLSTNNALQRIFHGMSVVPSGVCSLQLKPDASPWIVCPHRILVLARNNIGQRRHQEFAESLLLQHAGYPSGTVLGVWPELKMKFVEKRKSFDYTFDYILMPLGRASSSDVETATKRGWGEVRPMIEVSGYSLAKRGLTYYVDDFPVGAPTIVEIMTSSTSGGNKDKRTTIPMAFEDVMLGKTHEAPGINYRQVWARMVSQLIVKSEVGIGWGGKTFWVLQDVLVDYISSSTGLDVYRFLAAHPSEVNILSLSYGNTHKNQGGIIELNEGKLFAGPIRPQGSNQPSFQDMVRAPICPSITRLLDLLMRRAPSNRIAVP